ncbi:major facilitator superfamily domain-containing protein [Geopyxis carbonaria]|nr:major facilitator superfamily domain-containing protein [Geopyxis carbonaria]
METGMELEASVLRITPKKRWAIAASLCFNAFVLTMGSSIIAPCVPTLMVYFECKQLVAILTISLYVIGQTIGPLVFAPISEVYGRRVVLVPLWIVYSVFYIGCAKATNIQTLLISRIISGTAGSPAVTVAAGMITDIFPIEEVGVPVGLLSISAFLGPVAGPIAGGYLLQYAPGGVLESWRWTMWFMLIVSGVSGLNFLWIPETHASTIKRNSEKQKTGTEGLGKLLKRSIGRTIELLVMDPIVLLMSLYMALIFGILYLYFAAYPLVFTKEYVWKSGPSGLAFLGIGLGVLIATGTSSYSNKLYLRAIEKYGRDGAPEARLPLSLFAAVASPVSAFWFAWTGDKDIHWMAPVSSGVLFGWSMVTVFACLIGYLAEAYTEYTASVIGSATITRSLFAFGFPLFMPSLYGNLNTKWAGTLLGCLLCLFVPVPWVFYKYGLKIRSKSRYVTKSSSQSIGS